MSFTHLLLRFICFSYFLPFLILGARNNKNITVGSTLTAGDESESPWLSPSGDFAFGFQRAPGPTGGFLVAIWYDKIPEKTVTWSANRDELAPPGSKLELTKTGLFLNRPDSTIAWSKTGGNGDIYGAMLDNGNFKLANVNGGGVWQSFNEPTDTILPTQTMNQGTLLTARFSETNYSNGRFQLMMQTGGNLEFYTLNWPQQSHQYFKYHSIESTNGYQVVFNQSGPINVIAQNGTIVGQVLTYTTDPAEDLYERAILEPDGVFRRYVYPKSSSANQPRNWTMQEFVPQNICSKMTGDVGGGVCGFNTYCEMGDDKRPMCTCIPSYSFIDEMDRPKGCKPDFVMQSCIEEDDDFEFIEKTAMNFMGADLEALFGESRKSCRESCLTDCLCAAAVLDGDHCWKKRFPISNGITDLDVTQISFIKVRIGNSTTKLNLNQTNYVRDDKYRAIVLIGSPFVGASIFAALAAMAMWFFRRTRQGENQQNQHHDVAGTNIKSFGYGELVEATNGFEEVIGQGAYATVYKGVFGSDVGNPVAVKKLNEFSQENQREFDGEVKAISRTGHRNLVRLLGFCNEERHRLLVYEYMPNGSLADMLFKGQKPNWSMRIKFTFEIARGLRYLHEECSIQIIHCDIKPQNILLDPSFTVRISDFGLAKLLKKDQAHTLTGVRGTKGYVAPEWFKSMPITTKVDVYSYGVLLLEIICCRRCFIADIEDESQMVLTEWAYDCYKEDRIGNLVEGDNEALEDIEKVKKLVMVGLWCTQEDPSNRPSMNRVVEMIKGVLEVSPPSDIASYIISMDDDRGSLLPSMVGDFSNV